MATMIRESFQKAVDAFKQRIPFQPYVIELEDGRRFVVGDPKVLRCYAGAGTFLHPNGDFDFVDSENVKQLVELTPAPSA
jgi:hypothetical protein